MIINKRFFIVLLLIMNLNLHCFAVQDAVKYPNYAEQYLGKDKFENFNRKMFNLNMRMNKYALRPIHIIWASIMPKYGMDRIQGVYTNIQYPKRLISSLVQRDLKTSKDETIRFITNSTIGIGGMFDPASKLFKLNARDEGMEEALAKCKVKQGPFLVMPWLNTTTPRGMAGSLLDNALNPSNYIGSPVVALVKLGFTVNRTYFMQPLCKLIESTYADPYDIAKKMYGLERYIKTYNLDKKEVLAIEVKLAEKAEYDISSLTADINLDEYKPQNPVIDAMRTALFQGDAQFNKSIWSEFSIWNRCFSKQIKIDSVTIDPSKENYKYRYILQKDKTAPVAIIYPSIGEGIYSSHSDILAKMFYDEGYSVIIQGSHFHWEFVKSMPDSYKPGLPYNDADYLKLVTYKILDKLETKYDCNFRSKTLIGTSFGAMTSLFVAQKESENNTLGIDKYISINPPIELMYAMQQIDNNTAEWQKKPENLKERVAVTAAKVLQLSNSKDNAKIETLPFTDDEAKLITGFVLHQKLSDLVFTLEGAPKNKKSEIYNMVNSMSYEDYANRYLGVNANQQDVVYKTSLHSISEFLSTHDNYKIYHALDDYLVNHSQLANLREYAGSNLVLLNHGSHLGFLYRNEFITALKNDIKLKPDIVAQKDVAN